MPTIGENYTKIKELISKYESKYQRKPGSVALLLACKGQPIEKMQAAAEAGARIFGENYIQQALPKMETLKDLNIEWHFIGKIQRNKTKKIAEHFTWVQSLSEEIIAKRLNEQRPSELGPLNVCIEVNINNESTKLGLLQKDVTPFAHFCKNLPNLKLRGLMAIPEQTDDLNETRENFRKLAAIYNSLQAQGFALDTLSMGMSADFEVAIAEGSTMVRIGTAIFGQRQT